MTEEWLLTLEERKEFWDKWLDTGKKETEYFKTFCQVQLAKAEPLIRKQERERILGGGIIKVMRHGDIIHRFWLKRGFDRGPQPEGELKVDYQATNENDNPLDIQIQWQTLEGEEV